MIKLTHSTDRFRREKLKLLKEVGDQIKEILGEIECMGYVRQNNNKNNHREMIRNKILAKEFLIHVYASTAT